VRAKRAEQRRRTIAVRAAQGRQRRFVNTLSRRIDLSVAQPCYPVQVAHGHLSRQNCSPYSL